MSLKFLISITALFVIGMPGSVEALDRSLPDADCKKVALNSGASSYLACQDCVEWDSGACVAFEGSCFLKQNQDDFVKTSCAPLTCGWPPEKCVRIYSGADAFQSFEGDTTFCADGARIQCSEQQWKVLN
jgi:hypothetical protein